MRCLLPACLLATVVAHAGSYAPAAGQSGSTAIAADDSRFVAWATAIGSLERGPADISNPDSPLVGFGNDEAVFGPPNAILPGGTEPVVSPDAILSLGDGGSITLLFDEPIADGASWDFAVFENAFNDTFLELAFVEVSSDGSHFFRFPSHSQTPTNLQITQSGTNNAIDPTNIDGFAGKYRAGFGTPFDLAVLTGTVGLDLNSIVAVRIVDVVGSINPSYATYDSDLHMVNDPWPTAFNTGGFDLDAIGVFHTVPEPGVAFLLAAGLLGGATVRKRARHA
jgi:hypothetical protein